MTRRLGEKRRAKIAPLVVCCAIGELVQKRWSAQGAKSFKWYRFEFTFASWDQPARGHRRLVSGVCQAENLRNLGLSV